MKIGDIVAPKSGLVRATKTEVDKFEEQFWLTFPQGYREYVTQLGEGVLGDGLVRVYPPWRIKADLDEWRDRIRRYWFWDKGKKLLPKERALECVIIADTTDGDELVFHPTRPDKLFVLPRESEQIFLAGGDLLAAVAWLLGSGKLFEATTNRDFVPFDSRKESRRTRSESVEDPPGESIEEIIDMARRWAKRHKLRTAARKDLREWNYDIPHLTDRKVDVLHEGIVFDASFPYTPGYLVLLGVKDKQSKLEIGTFRWNLADDGMSTGCSLEANRANIRKLKKK